MKASRRITVTYRKYGHAEPSVRTVEPYCIKLFQRRWYALVRHITRDSLFALSFDRILDIQLTEKSFKMDHDFDAQSWFIDCYGVVRNQDAELERVVIRAYGREAYYLRELPFHHSQRIIASGEDWTDFEYILRISSDFSTPLLSQRPEHQSPAAAMVGRGDKAAAAEGGGIVWRIISTGYCIFESCIGKISLYLYYFCTTKFIICNS